MNDWTQLPESAFVLQDGFGADLGVAMPTTGKLTFQIRRTSQQPVFGNLLVAYRPETGMPIMHVSAQENGALWFSKSIAEDWVEIVGGGIPDSWVEVTITYGLGGRPDSLQMGKSAPIMGSNGEPLEVADCGLCVGLPSEVGGIRLPTEGVAVRGIGVAPLDQVPPVAFSAMERPSAVSGKPLAFWITETGWTPCDGELEGIWPLVRDLVVQRGVGLGDVIFALSVAEAMKRKSPQARLHFQTDTRFVEFVSWFPFVDSVSALGAPFDPRPETLQVNLSDIPVADGEDRIAVMSHIVGLSVTQFASRAQVPSFILDQVDVPLEEAGIQSGEQMIAVAPFSSGRPPSRSLTSDEVNALLRRLRRANLAGPSTPKAKDKPRPQTRLIVLHSEPVPGLSLPDGAVDFCGRLSVVESIALVCRCSQLIGVDSGMLYAALMLRVPSVGLYSHIAPRSRAGCATGCIALRPVGRDCFPCGDFSGQAPCVGFPWEHECMRITGEPNAILQALRDVNPQSKEVRDVRSTRGGRRSVRVTRAVGSKKPKLLFVVPWLFAGGGERHLLLLCQGLSAVADIEIVVVNKHHSHHFATEFTAWPVAMLDGNWEMKARTLSQVIDYNRPHILGFYNNPLALDALTRAHHHPDRVFAIIHTQFEHEMDMLTHEASGLVDVFVCVSETVRQVVASRLVEERPLSVIRNGVRLEDFEKCGSLRVEMGYRPEDFVLGSIGRIAAGKNVDLSIRALDLLPEKVKELFIGWGEEVDKCQQLAQDLRLGDRVRILGASTNVAPRFRSLDAFVLPSDIEGAVPYALMEAMAARVPTLVTPVTDVPLLFRDGKEVLLIEKTPESIAEAVSKLLASPALCEALAEGAHSVLEQRLSVRQMIEEYRKALSLSSTGKRARPLK